MQMPTHANDNHLEDWDLLDRKERSDDAFAIIFCRHKDFVYRLAMGFSARQDLADEITQEVFIRIVRGRKRWKPRAKFTTWLYRVTLNTSRELMRKRLREQKMLDKLKLENSIQSHNPSDKEDAPDLQNIIRKLPDRQREALVLRYYERLSIRETAKIMGCREGTIKSHLHKALKNMRRHLGATR
jgi:RNA polymerase sigma-70 factor (ECF subfamily)